MKAIGPTVDGKKGAAIEQHSGKVLTIVGGMSVVVHAVSPFFSSRAGRRPVFQHRFSEDAVAKQVCDVDTQRPVDDLLGCTFVGFVHRCAARVASCLLRPSVSERHAAVGAAIDGARLQLTLTATKRSMR